MDFLRTVLHDLLAWVEGFAATPQGDLALFLIAVAESSFFPIPPDVLLIALCLGRPESSLWFAFLCSVGSVLGGMIGYGIGFYGGRPVLKRFFSSAKVRAVESYYDRFNAWATGIAGLTPIPYKIFTIAGGAFAINFKIFVFASIVSRSLRFFAVATLFYFYGVPVRAFIDKYLNLLSIGFVILGVLGYLAVTKGFRHAAQQTDGVAPEAEPAPEEGAP